MNLTRRHFIRNMGLGFAGAGLAAEQLAAQGAGPSGGSEKLLVENPRQPEPAPLGFDRLPLAWYQNRVRQLKEKTSTRNLDAILFQSDANIVYFSGCFRSGGERPTWTLFPVREDNALYWFSPGIDRDLITTWWCTDNEYYFCYPHAEGGFPNRGALAKGRRVDLFAWMLQGLKKRGWAGKTIGTDWPLDADQLQSAKTVLPGARFVDIEADCLGMRIIKTPEEISLTQRAYRYFDKIHAFSRDYVLERGLEATDFELGQALQAYGIRLMMKDVRSDGRPHKGVGIEVTSNYVRAGVASAYPHPNQFFYHPIKRGEPLYVNTDIKLGGYGGEGYRNYLIAPWTAGQVKMWEVVADSVRLMVEEAKPGRTCADVAFKVHQHQIKQGMRDFIYHRPGHGQGQAGDSGHQPPFLSLGDETVIEEGMMFSVEPGLFDPKNGLGINPSDNLLITKNGSVLLSRVPYSKEWSFLKI
jgi:Xaa-Pro aminopeptidase